MLIEVCANKKLKLIYDSLAGSYYDKEGNRLAHSKFKGTLFDVDNKPVLCIPFHNLMSGEHVGYLPVAGKAKWPAFFHDRPKGKSVTVSSLKDSIFFMDDLSFSTFFLIHPEPDPNLIKVLRFFGYDQPEDFFTTIYRKQREGILLYKSVLYCDNTLRISLSGNARKALGYKSDKQLFGVLDVMTKEFPDVFKWIFISGSAANNSFEQFDTLYLYINELKAG